MVGNIYLSYGMQRVRPVSRAAPNLREQYAAYSLNAHPRKPLPALQRDETDSYDDSSLAAKARGADSGRHL
jgi:hypothetical protein